MHRAVILPVFYGYEVWSVKTSEEHGLRVGQMWQLFLYVNLHILKLANILYLPLLIHPSYFSYCSQHTILKCIMSLC